MKKIILSADDFGRSHERNLAIDYAMKHGMVKSAALIMGSEFTDEAVDFAYRGRYIKNIHCHLNLITNSDNNFVPLSDEFKESKFCMNGQFKGYPKKIEYAEYTTMAYKEMEKQYLEFRKLTKGEANYNHIDCHVYCNLWPPVAAAYKELIRKYGIRSARYYGEHHKNKKQLKQKLKFRIANFLGGNEAYAVKSCNIDYYITLKDSFQPDETVELYVHPDYINGILIDNTVSIFGHEKVPLIEQIETLTSTGDVELISWVDFNKNIHMR